MLDIISGNTTQEIQSDIKEETVTIKEKGSTVEDTCTVYVQGESMKMKSKKKFLLLCFFKHKKNNNFNKLIHFQSFCNENTC